MDLKKLNDRQLEAVKYTDGALLVLAGAGSGKTRVLTYRIAYLIDDLGVDPYSILALTFTNKAANEMKHRIESVVGDRAAYVWAGTFHSVCSKILRRHASELGYSSNFAIYDSADQKSLVKSIMKSLNLDPKDLSPNFVLSEISMAKNKMLSVSDYRDSTFLDDDRERVADIIPIYNKVLFDNNAMDFDDLIIKTIDLFKSSDEILGIYSNRFKYIHVDEYQDTNSSQYILVKLLSSVHKNICAVGDQDQSIYSWRGADIRNIRDFEKDFESAKTVLLEQNYRSSANILGLANALISNNDDRIDKNLWTESASGEKIRYYLANNEEDEARYVAKTVMEGRNKGRNFGDYAVMYRSNSQSRDFEQFFAVNGIPYKIVGGLKYYDRKEIKDLLAYLRVVLNPNDSVAGLRVINEPRRGIGAKTVEKIMRFASVNEIGFLEAVQRAIDEKLFKGKAREGLVDFFGSIQSSVKMLDNSKPSEILNNILSRTGYLKILEDARTMESNSRIENIQELISQIMNLESTRENFTLADYLEDVSLLSDVDQIDEDESGAVLFMTLHSAKGLEFPVVFMVGLEENIFPSYYASTGDRGIDEERRLCYVGITRAMEELHVTHADMRFRFGKHSVNRPSVFLEEMPEEFLERITPAKREYINNDGPVSRVKMNGKFSDEQRSVSALSADDICVGSKVKHKFFGRGVVIRMNDRSGDKELLVAFDDKGLKNLMLSSAPLDVLG